MKGEYDEHLYDALSWMQLFPSIWLHLNWSCFKYIFCLQFFINYEANHRHLYVLCSHSQVHIACKKIKQFSLIQQVRNSQKHNKHQKSNSNQSSSHHTFESEIKVDLIYLQKWNELCNHFQIQKAWKYLVR